MTKSIVSSRVWTIITSSTLDVQRQVGINKVSVLLGPRSVETLQLGIMGVDSFVARTNIKPRLLGDDRKNALPASVRFLRNGMIGVVLGGVFGAVARQKDKKRTIG